MSEQARPPALFDRTDAVLATLAGVLALALYARTLAPGVLPGDSGEFQVLAYQLGIAHTTGYPVYMLLAKLFITLVPLESVAYRVNLFSAFMGALTVAGVYLSARLLSRSAWAALVAALALMVSYTLWSQSVIAEVYAPGAAFLAAVWLLVLVWYRTGNQRALFAAGLCGGLGLGVHGSLSVVAPAIGVFLLLNWKRWRELWRPALLGALLGAVLYLAVFFAVDLHAPPANIFDAGYGPARSAWGLSESDIQSPVGRVWFNLSAGQWQGRMFEDPQSDTPKNAEKYIDGLEREFSPWLLGLALIGLLILFIREWRVGILFLTALVLHWVFYFNYRVGDQYVFFIPSYMWLAMLAAVALGGLAWVSPKEHRDGVGRVPVRPARIALAAISMLAILYLGVLPVLTPRWQAVQQGKLPFLGNPGYVVDGSFNLAYQQVLLVVKDLEPDAIMFQGWGLLYPYWYAAHIEQGRIDLRFIEQNPYHESPGFPASTVEFIRANNRQHPIYLVAHQPEVVQAGFKLVPVRIGFAQFYKVEEP
jgi:hypothetical protein